MNYQLPTVLIVTEGLTERKYLSHLSKRNSGYVVRVVESPRKDPLSIVRFCLKEVSNRGLDPADDSVYCVIDVDFNSRKKLEQAISLARDNGVTVVISNPCFEVYYISHFRQPMPSFSKPGEAKSFLRGYIPSYSESNDYWHLLEDKQQKALNWASMDLKDVPLELGKESATNIGVIFGDIEKRDMEKPSLQV